MRHIKIMTPVAILGAALALSACQPTTAQNTIAATNDSAQIKTASSSAEKAMPVIKPDTKRRYQVGASKIQQGTCNVEAKTIWHDTYFGRYWLEAVSVGRSCESAKVSLAIRAPNSKIIMRSNFEASELQGFQKAQNAVTMRSTLIRWMTNHGRSGQTSTFLPDWVEAQFSRLVLDASVTKESYTAVREAARPMLCFADSLTTKRCIVLSENGQRLERIGHIDTTR